MAKGLNLGGATLNLLERLPPFMREYDAFQALAGASGPEFDAAWAYHERLRQDLFVMTAGDGGLRRFEQMLGLAGAEGEGLEERRRRILARLNALGPYTWRFLTGWLALLTGTRPAAAENERLFTLVPRFEAYTIEVWLHGAAQGRAVHLYNELRPVVPANMIISMGIDAAVDFHTGNWPEGRARAVSVWGAAGLAWGQGTWGGTEEEIKMIHTRTTQHRREALAKVTSGIEATMAPVRYIAFGTGAPSGDAPGHEIGRYEAAAALRTDIPGTVSYTAAIPADELGGLQISEAALVDSDGKVCALAHFPPREKPFGVVLSFTIHDRFGEDNHGTD